MTGTDSFWMDAKDSFTTSVPRWRVTASIPTTSGMKSGMSSASVTATSSSTASPGSGMSWQRSGWPPRKSSIFVIPLKGVTAGDFDDLPRKHLCLLTGQKQDGLGNVFRLDEFAHGDERKDGFFQFFIDPSRLRRTRGYAIHGNPVLRHFDGDAAGQRFQRRFAGAIGNLTGKYLRRDG